jgi:hypothetical protein
MFLVANNHYKYWVLTWNPGVVVHDEINVANLGHFWEAYYKVFFIFWSLVSKHALEVLMSIT